MRQATLLPSSLVVATLALSGCNKGNEAAIKALQEERELLKATRLELQETVTKLEPMIKMAELVDTYGLTNELNPRDPDDPSLGELLDFDDDPVPSRPYIEDAQELEEDDPRALLDGISKVGENHYRVTHTTLEKFLENPMTVARGARIVPSIANGKANGFKLYAIRPSSIYTAIGLMNGDTIHTINDMELSSPDKALEVYTKLRESKSFTVRLTRRGKPVSLRIDIVK